MSQRFHVFHFLIDNVWALKLYQRLIIALNSLVCVDILLQEGGSSGGPLGIGIHVTLSNELNRLQDLGLLEI